MNPSSPPRLGGADFLKAFAILGVVLIHVSARGFQNPTGGFDWFSALFWGSVSRASVPIFLMVTGALMLDPARQLNLKKLWTRNIPRLLAALLVWAFVYQVYRLIFVSHWFTPAGVVQAVKDVLLFHHEEHLYYLHIALLVYALLPAVRLVTAHGDRRTLEYLLLIWAVLGILYPTFKGIWPLTLLYGIPTQYALNLAYMSVGYALLGWYLRTYARSPGKWAAVAAAGFALTFGGTAAVSLAQGSLEAGFLSGNSPGVALLGAGVCGWAFAVFRERPAPKAAQLLAKASFCIYLCHVLFLWRLNDLVGLNANTGPCLLFIPLTTAAVLGCSLVVWAVLSRVPVIRDWLI